MSEDFDEAEFDALDEAEMEEEEALFDEPPKQELGCLWTGALVIVALVLSYLAASLLGF